MRERMVLYRFFDAAGDLLYVGITNSITHRVGEHLHAKPWFLDVVSVTIEHFGSRDAAEDAERLAIQAESPRYNVEWKLRAPHRERPLPPLDDWLDIL